MKNLTIRNLREKVYNITKIIVLSNGIPAGSKINEDELAKKIGVSKTPVREALSRLAHDGIVQIKPNRGTFKVKFTKKNLSEFMMIREALEVLSIRLAIKNVDKKMIKRLRAILNQFSEDNLENTFLKYVEAQQKYQSLLYGLSRSPRLIRMIESIHDLTHMLRVQYLNHPERVKRSLVLHRKLVDALEKGNADLAVTIHKKTMEAAYNYFLDTIREE